MTVRRLDFSKPPPGFNLDDLPRHLTMTVRTAGVWGPNALSAAWTHHKARHDPPGMFVLKGQTCWTWGDVQYEHGRCADEAEARAAAWAWYEDALKSGL